MYIYLRFFVFFFIFLCTFFAFFASADRRRRYIRYRDNIGYPRYGERYDIGDNQYSSNNLSYCPINRFLESVPTLTWLTTGPARVGGHGSTLWVFLNKSALRADLRVLQRVGCRGWGCAVPLGGLKTRPQLAPGEHRTVGGSKRNPRHTSPRGLGLTGWTTGPARVGGPGSTLWVFLNKSALRADLRVFQRVGCRALGCAVPLGGLKTRPQLPPGEHRTVGGSKRTLRHTSPRGMGLTWSTPGPPRVGGVGSTLWVFWNKSALRADLRVFQRVGCRGLGCVVPRGLQNHASAGPWGASHRRGVKENPPTHLPKGPGLDLVDDGTPSRGRGRLDVMGFLEQVRTSCGPQSL